MEDGKAFCEYHPSIGYPIHSMDPFNSRIVFYRKTFMALAGQFAWRHLRRKSHPAKKTNEVRHQDARRSIVHQHKGKPK